MYRTIKSDLESEYEMKLNQGCVALPWLVRHASMCIYWSQVGEDGKTPIERLKGKKFNTKCVKFGECVWYLKPKSKSKKL